MQTSAPAEVLHVGDLEIRPQECQLLGNWIRVGLTVREFETFVVLARASRRVVPRHRIYGLVWGDQMSRRNRSVDVFVRKVRGKLSAAAPEWSYIHTHLGIGYRLSAGPRRSEPTDAFVTTP